MDISPEGTMLLAFNDASQSGQRTPLALSSSADHGQSWEEALVLEDNLMASFSYPTLLCPAAADYCFVIYTVNVRPAEPVMQKDVPCNRAKARNNCGKVPYRAACDHSAALPVIPHSSSCGESITNYQDQKPE